MNRGIALAAVVAAAAIMGGCEQIRGMGRQEELVAAREPIVTDIPVPEGFKMDLQKSFYYAPATGAVRRGKLTYTGRAKKEDLITFFRENMPVSGWTMKNEEATFDSFVMNFEKGEEAARVGVTPYRFSTDVTVQLGRTVRE